MEEETEATPPKPKVDKRVYKVRQPRNQRCACGSGKKAKHCCVTYERWYS